MSFSFIKFFICSFISIYLPVVSKARACNSFPSLPFNALYTILCCSILVLPLKTFEQILAQKKEIFSLKSKNRRIHVELDSLRNQSIEDDLEIIDELYWAVLTRPPSAAEWSMMLSYVSLAENRRSAMEDVSWGLLNAKEFLLRK